MPANPYQSPEASQAIGAKPPQPAAGLATYLAIAFVALFPPATIALLYALLGKNVWHVFGTNYVIISWALALASLRSRWARYATGVYALLVACCIVAVLTTVDSDRGSPLGATVVYSAAVGYSLSTLALLWPLARRLRFR